MMKRRDFLRVSAGGLIAVDEWALGLGQVDGNFALAHGAARNSDLSQRGLEDDGFGLRRRNILLSFHTY